MTTWRPRPRAPSTQRTWTLTRECAVLLFVSQVLFVMIHTPHRMAQVCLVRASHVHTWSERISSTLSPPFSSSSSSPHSSLTSRTSSCTSSTTLRAVALRPSPWRTHRLWAQVLRPRGDSFRVLHRVPDPPTVLRARVPRGCGLRWHNARGDPS